MSYVEFLSCSELGLKTHIKLNLREVIGGWGLVS
jgi:hypothetical protein